MKRSLTKVIVVGASSGIGEAIARRLAERGAQVAVLARREAELERMAAAYPGKVRAYAHDVRDFDSVRPLFERIAADLGGVDTLIYSSGVMLEVAEGEYDFEKERQMVEVNVTGAMAWMVPAAARFEAARSGTIVGISSVAGERGRRANPGYGTTKAALTTYLEALRNRCSRYGVNVVTVKPGFIDTPMTRGKKGLFWLVSADVAARQTLALAERGSSASGFVPARWALVGFVIRHFPSFLFRKLNV